MALTLLLVLAGLLETTDSQARAKPGGARLAVAAQAGRPENAFKVAPLLNQLENKRTGVSCTLRILRIDPPVDAAMVGTAPATTNDHMARNELSPCVE